MIQLTIAQNAKKKHNLRTAMIDRFVFSNFEGKEIVEGGVDIDLKECDLTSTP
jgi:hypothetical protein